MTNNGNSQQFMTLADGTLNPDVRVNYEFGLVLGVNEFRQEQKYFLEKDYLHNRELHGYGTVSGLQVAADAYPSTDNQTDVQITVKPGMALDQVGRPIVVRADQCARLGAWLAQQEKANPGTLARRPTDDEGYMTVYVVISYTEEGDKLVPVTGLSYTNGTDKYSRIRDSYDIEFSWNLPQMPAWDALRDFAALLAQIHITPGISSEDNSGDEDD